MKIIGTLNTTSQTLLTGELLNLGNVYRRYDSKGSCGLRTYDFNANGITLQHSGIYKVTANITFTAPVAGNVIFQLTNNGTPITGATATETVTTATTEVNTTTIDFFVLVDRDLILNTITTIAESIGVINAGVSSTVTNLVVNAVKVA